MSKNKNKLLEEDSKKKAELGITLHPGLTINDKSYRGYLEGADVFNAICSSYNHQPKGCQDAFEEEMSVDHRILSEEWLAEHKDDTDPVHEDNGVHQMVLWGIFAFLIILQIVVFIVLR